MSEHQSHVQVFDPQHEYAVVKRRLPHWSQAGTLVFITWRTWDSIPQNVLESWLSERAAWLREYGISPDVVDSSTRLRQLSFKVQADFQRLVADRWNEHLDACHGACVLRRHDLSEIVATALQHFDGDRYELTDFVVMPNHMHVLASFADEASMLDQCESWKHFTAVAINRVLGRKGRFWQQDGFDHLVRSTEQFDHLRRYIAENPQRARLANGEFYHWSKPI